MPGDLIVTGDDFGASPEVNEAVAAAHQGGVLTSASLIATAPAFDDAASRARRLPGLATGLHLVLCDGRAASEPSAIPDLVDREGRFEPSPARAGLRYFARRRTLRSQLAREIRAQIERYLASGLALDHVDGHHHLHMHPVVFDLLLDALLDCGAGWVRLVHEDRLGRIGPPRPRRDAIPAVFALLARRNRRRAAARGVAGPARVYGLRATGRLGERELLRLLRGLRASPAEIYAHPSRASAAGRAEEAALVSPAVRRAVKEAGYALSSPRSLARRAAAPR